MAGSRDRKVVELFGPDALSRRTLYAPSAMEERGTSTATADAAADDQQIQKVVTVGEFTLDRVTGELSSGDDVVVLQPSTLGVLAFLIDRAGQVVSSETLIAAVWPNRIIGDDAVHRRIADLRKQLGDDSRRPRYVETLPRRGYRLIAPVSVATPPGLRRRRRLLLTTAAICIVLPIIAFFGWQQQLKVDHQARLDRIAKLVEQGDGFNTFLEMQKVRAKKPDSTLRILTASVLQRGRLESDPAGAQVSIRPRSDDPWHHIGATPLKGDFPIGIYSIRLEKPGYAPRMILEANPGLSFNNIDERNHRLRLRTTEEVEPSTVLVQGGEFLTPFIMTRKRYELDDFLIDRFEVTNTEFRAFVEAGGYENGSFWTDYPTAVTEPPRLRFTDTTGATGPASWEFGTFPTGTGSLPVTGVSWYEAQAYARWSGRHLPTALDWGRAALSPVEWDHPIGSVVVESANLVEGHLLPVGASRSLSANGAVDLVGNAREWTSSVANNQSVVVGGSYASPREHYAFPQRIDPYDRSLINGFRTVTYLGERNAQLVTALESGTWFWYLVYEVHYGRLI
jgi:DNA-binding winged helix-turn-helix (wHTH) protein